MRWLLALVALTGVASADPAGTPLPDPPAKLPPPRSLRDEATRVASDLVLAGNTTRDADFQLMPWQFGRWTTTTRSANLQAGAAAATLAGEAVLGLGGSPLAALGLFAAGATLDAASADIEANAPPPPPKKQKPIKHKLR